MPKFILEEDDEDLFNFNLFGIQSTINEDFRFVYHINKYYQTRFQRTQDLLLLHKREQYSFSVFQYLDEQNHAKYTIYSNQSFSQNKFPTNELTLFDSIETNLFILPQYKQFNYLLKAEENELHEISLHLQTNSFINLVFSIPLKSLKNKENLIL